MLPTESSVRVLITGRVQGVWFRGWTVEQARARGLRGWVRNRTDGSVEAVFCGPVDLVDEMVESCRMGPPSADVTRVLREICPKPDTEKFRQERSA